jgi:hypothetical protein
MFLATQDALTENWSPASSRCKLLSMVINVIGVPIQSTKSKAEDTANRELRVAPPKGGTMEEQQEREQCDLHLTISEAQQIIDYMGQMIELGHWAQANPVPTLAQFLHSFFYVILLLDCLSSRLHGISTCFLLVQDFT